MGEKFERLRKHIEREYVKEGYSKEQAERIGYATAGKVHNEQLAEHPLLKHVLPLGKKVTKP